MISYTNDNSPILQSLGLETIDRQKMVTPHEAASYLGVSEYNLKQWRTRGTYNLPFSCEGYGRCPKPMYRMGDLMDLKERGIIRVMKPKIAYASRKAKIPLTQKGDMA